MPDDDARLTSENAVQEANRCDAAANDASDLESAELWRELARRWRQIAVNIGAHLDGKANF